MPHQVPQSLVLVVGLCVIVHPCRSKSGMRSIRELGNVFVDAISGGRDLHYLIVR